MFRRLFHVRFVLASPSCGYLHENFHSIGASLLIRGSVMEGDEGSTRAFSFDCLHDQNFLITAPQLTNRPFRV